MAYEKVVLHYVLKRYTEGTLYDVTLKYIDNSWKLTGAIGGGCVCSDTESLEITPSKDQVERLLEQIETIAITPLFNHENEVEEGFEELTITNGVFRSSFVWDEHSPNSFNALQRVTRTIQQWIKNSK